MLLEEAKQQKKAVENHIELLEARLKLYETPSTFAQQVLSFFPLLPYSLFSSWNSLF